MFNLCFIRGSMESLLGESILQGGHPCPPERFQSLRPGLVYLAKWQAAQWPAATSRNTGASVRQRASATGQRG